ncbi:transposase [Komagataeibacter saccharivorans]|uniref:transposase n=1 Tax=Komagataeibacter saccharivorans TaxID=265959 RepID=UPI0024A89E79|nr:transposase [Komagataeibacter saccharivorans]
MSYSTDLTDEQWRLIRSHIPGAKQGGRPREANMRRVVDAIMYVVTHGCKWRGLPTDFPPWRTVYGYFADLQKRGRWRHIHYDLYGMVRKAAGRDEQPSLLVIDSQSVKTGKVLWCRLFFKSFTKNFLMVFEIGPLFQYFSGTIMLSGTGWRM